MKPNSQRYLFDAPGAYRIRVHGHLAADWADSFCGMRISARRVKGKPVTTTLSGRLIDQASLMGVLTSLYDMGYTLLAVRRLPESPTDESPNSDGPG